MFDFGDKVRLIMGESQNDSFLFFTVYSFIVSIGLRFFRSRRYFSPLSRHYGSAPLVSSVTPIERERRRRIH
jgi:hypothetical protein